MAAKLRWTAPVLLAAPEGDGPRKWTSRAYSGGLMRPSSPKLDAPLILDLTGAEFAPSVVANLFHDETRIVGHVTEKNVTQSAVDVGGVVSGGGADAEQFLNAAGKGFPWQASLEADLSRVQKTPAGRSVQVNGQTIAGPVYVARHSLIFGVAFLGRGADESTSVVLSAGAADGFSQGENDMDYSQWLAALGLEEESLNDAQKAKLKAKYDAEKADKLKAGAGGDGGDDPDPPVFDLDRLKAAYAAHEADLETRTFKYAGKVKADEAATLKAGAMKAAVELKSKALAEEWAPERFEVAALKAAMDYELSLVKAEAPKGPAIHNAGRDLNANVLQAAMCQSLGIDVEKDFDDKTLQAAHTAFRGRLGLHQLLLMAASENGYSVGPFARIDDGNIRDVLEYAFPPRMLRAAGATVVSLPGILGAVANKEIRAGFDSVDATWRQIAAIRSVTNFHAVTSYRMLDDMEYKELPPDATIDHGAISEESYTRQARTYARMAALTRQDIINDDLGALQDLRNRLGRGAAKALNRIFWTRFVNNSTFFTAARANYITGATTNLGADLVGLDLGVLAFNALRSTAVPPATQGDLIGGSASILLVPPELDTISKQIYANLGAVAVANQNVFQGKYRPVMSPWLSDSNYTGHSATAWYLLRDPADLAAVVVSFLNGNQTPVVESADADFSTLGIQFRGYHDFGCDFAEWLCGIKSKGSA